MSLHLSRSASRHLLSFQRIRNPKKMYAQIKLHITEISTLTHKHNRLQLIVLPNGIHRWLVVYIYVLLHSPRATTAMVKAFLVCRQWNIQICRKISTWNLLLHWITICVLEIAEQYNRLRCGTKIDCLYRCCMKSINLYLLLANRGNVMSLKIWKFSNVK